MYWEALAKVIWKVPLGRLFSIMVSLFGNLSCREFGLLVRGIDGFVLIFSDDSCGSYYNYYCKDA